MKRLDTGEVEVREITDPGELPDAMARMQELRLLQWAHAGKEITAQDVAFGMTRCMDAATFPTGACQYYSNAYFKGGADYKGMYTDPGSSYKGITVDGDTITIKMAKPFPDMPYWGSFPANGPIPEGKASDPNTYKKHPWSTGPYMIKSYSPYDNVAAQAYPADPDHRLRFFDKALVPAGFAGPMSPLRQLQIQVKEHTY